MSASVPKKKPTKAFHLDPMDEDAWFDPVNSENEPTDEEIEGKPRRTESWHAFGTY
jgi:hypothetical protein